MENLIKEAFKKVLEIRKILGLKSFETAPTFFSDIWDCYSSIKHEVSIKDKNDTFALYHECCHACQRDYLLSTAGKVYKSATPYEDRWYEKEADVLAELTCLADMGVKIKEGDQNRLYPGQPRRYSRSLRKRIGNINQAKEIAFHATWSSVALAV